MPDRSAVTIIFPSGHEEDAGEKKFCIEGTTKDLKLRWVRTFHPEEVADREETPCMDERITGEVSWILRKYFHGFKWRINRSQEFAGFPLAEGVPLQFTIEVLDVNKPARTMLYYGEIRRRDNFIDLCDRGHMLIKFE
jgi:hypothetical protein